VKGGFYASLTQVMWPLRASACTNVGYRVVLIVNVRLKTGDQVYYTFLFRSFKDALNLPRSMI